MERRPSSPGDFLLVWLGFSSRGEVSERFKEHAWKACVGETQPWVRIPPSPPSSPHSRISELPTTENSAFRSKRAIRDSGTKPILSNLPQIGPTRSGVLWCPPRQTSFEKWRRLLLLGVRDGAARQLSSKNRNLNCEFESRPLGSQAGRIQSGQGFSGSVPEKCRDLRAKNSECVANSSSYPQFLLEAVPNR
jgi:hypothetical protein